MIEKTIQFYTKKEEEFVNLLVRIGIKKTIARTLVCLGRLKSATSREIEQGTDLRQPEVSTALKCLTERGWVDMHEQPQLRGRPLKVWNLNVPVEKILDAISREKQEELNARLAAIRRVRSFV